MTKVRWGILGTSYISEVMAQAILASTTSQLVAIGSRSSVTARTFADKFSIPKVYTDYHALLNDPEIDAVYIGLPNHLHKDWIINCAEAGKHILCEKPLVLTAQEAEEAYAAVKKANVVCLEALMYRHHPLIQKLQELIQEKVIGDIRLFNATYTAHIVDKANPTAGGSIRNLGCYPISLVRLLANAEPIEITGFGRKNATAPNDSQASAILKFENNIIAVVSTADDMKMTWQFDVYGTEGSLKMITNPWLPDCDNNKIIINSNNNSPIEINVTADKPLYTYQIDVMSSKVRDDDAPLDEFSRKHSLGNAKVLEMWLESCKLFNHHI